MPASRVTSYLVPHLGHLRTLSVLCLPSFPENLQRHIWNTCDVSEELDQTPTTRYPVL